MMDRRWRLGCSPITRHLVGASVCLELGVAANQIRVVGSCKLSVTPFHWTICVYSEPGYWKQDWKSSSKSLTDYSAHHSHQHL